MENIEDIVFDRLCRYLEKFDICIINNIYGTYNLMHKNDVIQIIQWSSKHNMLFGNMLFGHGDLKNAIYSYEYSIFELSKEYHDYTPPFSTRLMYDYQIDLGKIWPNLCQICSDSLDEMLLKMDLIGI